ncbi:CvpA family protein [Dysgonomonas sp. BGC7]|uniref:CvpA family protein n=1 Tax=Dysgonomonas sp. BGC7 TaxID=1658008 RepID=UPI0006800DC3|nr:CvpA family protein [Dysgonomonas sp. BGC7]MBD8388101.1 CvpA family protein [Dysgonomonas sp. BGC7]
MNWFDLTIIIIIAASLIRGFFTGFIMQVATLAGLVLGAIFAGKLSEYIVPHLIELVSLSPHILGPLSYTIAFIIIIVALLFAGKLLESFIDALKMNFLNRLAGSLFSAAKWLILFSILLNLIVEFDQNERLIKKDVRENSHTYPYVIQVAQTVIPYLRFDWIDRQ